jgi:hypothetical protein
MEQETYANRWKDYHDNLLPETARGIKQQIEKVLCISQSAFYRKIKEPDRFLTIAEKQAISRVYELKETYLFPELAEELHHIFAK